MGDWASARAFCCLLLCRLPDKPWPRLMTGSCACRCGGASLCAGCSGTRQKVFSTGGRPCQEERARSKFAALCNGQFSMQVCRCFTSGCVMSDTSAGGVRASGDLTSCKGMTVATSPTAGASTVQALALPLISGSCTAAGAACTGTSCCVYALAEFTGQADRALMLKLW